MAQRDEVLIQLYIASKWKSCESQTDCLAPVSKFLTSVVAFLAIEWYILSSWGGLISEVKNETNIRY